MTNRSAELRARERRILRGSLGVAVALHAVAFGFVAWTRVAPEWSPGNEMVRLDEGSWSGTRVDVFFGPPMIFEADGAVAEQPPERTLEAARSLQMPPACFDRDLPPSAPGSGQVRLTVNASGRIDAVTLDKSTGDACWDLVAKRVAGDLWYRWLPSERFPAPIELLQPITVGLSQ
ncbi:MAG: hypothetical protein ACR2QM_12600 [Longimicrobiales bacterium]